MADTSLVYEGVFLIKLEHLKGLEGITGRGNSGKSHPQISHSELPGALASRLLILPPPCPLIDCSTVCPFWNIFCSPQAILMPPLSSCMQSYFPIYLRVPGVCRALPALFMSDPFVWFPISAQCRSLKTPFTLMMPAWFCKKDLPVVMLTLAAAINMDMKIYSWAWQQDLRHFCWTEGTHGFSTILVKSHLKMWQPFLVRQPGYGPGLSNLPTQESSF